MQPRGYRIADVGRAAAPPAPYLATSLVTHALETPARRSASQWLIPPRDDCPDHIALHAYTAPPKLVVGTMS